MYPTWESLGDAQAHREFLNQLALYGGVLWGLATVAAVFMWNSYTSHVDKEIAQLESVAQNARDEDVDSGIADLSNRTSEVEDRTPTLTGLLYPGSKPLPANIELPQQAPLPPADAEDFLTVIVGNNSVNTSTYPLTIIRQGDEGMLVLDRAEDGGLAVSAKFFNENGKVVCEIVRNRFTLNLQNHFRIEPPHPRSQFTVYDDEAKPIFEVDYLNEHAVQIAGQYYLRHGRFVSAPREGATSVGGDGLVAGPTIAGGTFGNMKLTLSNVPDIGVFNVATYKPLPTETAPRVPWLSLQLQDLDPKSLSVGGDVVVGFSLVNNRQDPIRIVALSPKICFGPFEYCAAFEAGVSDVQWASVEQVGSLDVPGGDKVDFEVTNGPVDENIVRLLQSGSATVWALTSIQVLDQTGQRYTCWAGHRCDPESAKFEIASRYTTIGPE